MGERPISLDRRGSRPKRKMNRSPEARKKLCPSCGARFATRPRLKKHLDSEHLEAEDR
jgi:hypothetical protein